MMNDECGIKAGNTEAAESEDAATPAKPKPGGPCLHSAFSIHHSAFLNKLARMDSNHDKQSQNLLCYRYTTGQSAAG